LIHSLAADAKFNIKDAIVVALAHLCPIYKILWSDGDHSSFLHWYITPFAVTMKIERIPILKNLDTPWSSPQSDEPPSGISLPHAPHNLSTMEHHESAQSDPDHQSDTNQHPFVIAHFAVTTSPL
jgi:hypothetical protein